MFKPISLSADPGTCEDFCIYLIAGIAGSKPAECMYVRLLYTLCCVGSGLCDELITGKEEFHLVCVCVWCVCVREREREREIEISTLKRSRSVLGCCVTDNKKESLSGRIIFSKSTSVICFKVQICS